MPTISGVTRDSSGAVCAAIVRAYRRDTGVFVGEALSSATTGAYSIIAPDTSPLVVYRLAASVSDSDPLWGNTSLAMHMDGSNGSTTFVDELGHTITLVGTAALSTSQKKYGVSSLLLSGGGGFQTDNLAAFGVGTGDFTIEMQVYMTSLTGYQCLFQLLGNGGTSNYLYLGIPSGSSGTPFQYYGGAVITGSSSFSINTWQHLALCRIAGVNYLYLDGALIGSAAFTVDLGTAGQIRIGFTDGVSQTAYAYVDDIRFTKGVGRYATAFTPPTSTFLGPRTIGSPTENAQIFDNVIPV